MKVSKELHTALLMIPGMIYITPNNLCGVLIQENMHWVVTFGSDLNAQAGPFEYPTEAKTEALYQAYAGAQNPGLRQMATKSKNDDVVRLFVLRTDDDPDAPNQSLEDSFDPFWTIGWQHEDGEWHICGWDWQHDQFTTITTPVTIIGWKHFHGS